MIKQLFSALTGIDEDDYESPESATLWELQRVIDECDIDDSDNQDEDEDEPSNKSWWQTW